jgi:hypothetical protein
MSENNNVEKNLKIILIILFILSYIISCIYTYIYISRKNNFLKYNDYDSKNDEFKDIIYYTIIFLIIYIIIHFFIFIFLFFLCEKIDKFNKFLLLLSITYNILLLILLIFHYFEEDLYKKTDSENKYIKDFHNIYSFIINSYTCLLTLAYIFVILQGIYTLIFQ